MPIAPGTPAPPFSLPSLDGHPTTLADVTDDGARPAILAFFKTSCPVCQLAFPVYGELARRLMPNNVAVVAVSQDGPSTARPWLAERGFDAAALALDDAHDGYAVSDSYGIRSVPTLVVIEADGTVGTVSEGWDRDAVNALAARFGTEPVSTPADGLPAFKPG
jgi:peroxiredoxin